MAGNTAPIFSKAGLVGMNNQALGITSYRSSDYTGATATVNQLILTADASNGSFVQKLRFKAMGSNATAAVARIYINNGGANTVAANNAFFGEIGLPVTVASTTNATVDIDYPMNIVIPAGYKIYVGISSSADLASGWICTAIAGAY